MITESEAKVKIQSEIDSYPQPEGDKYIVLDESTVSRDWGWVFFYTSEMWHKTGELSYAVAGNAPFIVEKSTGNVIVTGTAEPIESYIKRYETTGSPNA
jgi:oxalate decarboxylase/phosphoglucose isomerase-like protein (cupin superfamily)